MKLKNKIIVITGASGGAGKQIAFRLVKEKSDLAIITRNEKNLNKVTSVAKKLGANNIKNYICDLRQTNKLKLILKNIIFSFKIINILIDNANIWQKLLRIAKPKKEVVNNVIEINLSAFIHITRLLLPILYTRKQATIINIVSESGVMAQTEQFIHTASKYDYTIFT